MSHTAWVMIGCAAWTFISGVVLWLIRRMVSRLDGLELAVFGDGAKHPGLNMFATRSDLEGISEEGQKREERILSAITSNNTALVSELRDLKQDVRAQVKEVRDDVRAQAQRVDHMMRQDNGGR